MIDSALTWKYHISYVCAKLSRNTGVISKLRHYLPLKQLAQIYCSLIYPYISYAIVAWGSTSKTNLHKIQMKQNHVMMCPNQPSPLKNRQRNKSSAFEEFFAYLRLFTARYFLVFSSLDR